MQRGFWHPRRNDRGASLAALRAEAEAVAGAMP